MSTVRRLVADIRVVPLAALVLTFGSVVAFVLQFPTAAMWGAVAGLVVALCAMGTLVAESNRWRDLFDEVDQENAWLHGSLNEAQVAHPRPQLSLVRDEMDDSWLELLVTRPKPYGDAS